jgi:hypothetical protein
MTDEQTDMQHLGQKKKANGKPANTKSAVRETKKMTDQQTDMRQI